MCTLLDPTNLPIFMSPDCPDVEFVTGLVRTRPGLTSLFAAISGNPSIFGLKSFIKFNLTQLLMKYTSAGELYADLTLLRTFPFTNYLYNSVTASGKEFIAISDGKIGTVPPLSYDGTNLDPVAPQGFSDSTTTGVMTGTDSGAGNIAAGIHYLSVIFVTRSGYLASFSQSHSWNAGGAAAVDVTNIPLGPSNVVRRILVFTQVSPANNPGSFYYIPNSSMEINDNTTTSVTGIDFTDAQLAAGVNVDDIASLVSLPPCAGFVEYADRLVAWGCRTQIDDVRNALIQTTDLTNLSFDGGRVGTFPTGWASVVAGASIESSDTLAGVGNAIKLLGDGATAVHPQINNTLINPSFAIPKQSYTIRAAVKKTAGLVAGRLRILIFGKAGAGLSLLHSAVTTSYAWYEAEILTAADAPSGQFQLFVDQTATNGEGFLVDKISIFPTNQPFEHSTLLVSRADDLESFDGVNGRVDVAVGNGQVERSCFVLRDFLYIAKEFSLHVTSDDGVNEPANWLVREVSHEVGTTSVRGVGLGDEWAIIASQSGPFYFDGGNPIPIGNEIQPTWNAINWTYGHLLDVKVDTRRKRAYIAAPTGESQRPNQVFVLDFTEGFGDPLGANGFGRKWSIWNISSGALAITTPSAATHELYIGNGVSNGKIYKLDAATGGSDDGAAINGYWQSGYFQNGNRLLFGYLSAGLVGAGTAGLSIFIGDQSNARTLRGWTLNPNATHNLERQIQAVRERMSVKVGTSLATHWFSLQGLQMYVNEAPYSPVRGRNI